MTIERFVICRQLILPKNNSKHKNGTIRALKLYGDDKLKIIKLAVLNKNNEKMQISKIAEEYNEVLAAYISYKKSDLELQRKKEQLKEELFDLMQACFTMLNILGVDETDNEKHLKKMQHYKKIKRV